MSDEEAEQQEELHWRDDMESDFYFLMQDMCEQAADLLAVTTWHEDRMRVAKNLTKELLAKALFTRAAMAHETAQRILLEVIGEEKLKEEIASYRRVCAA